METIYRLCANPDYMAVICTLDEDDNSMNNPDIIGQLNSYRNIRSIFGKSESKVHAFNRDLDEILSIDFEILICFSDDMRFIAYGWDQIIREGFRCNFPDFDALGHWPDQDAKDMLATLYVAGKPFIKQMGYIYHPSYKSLWCDNDIMNISQIKGKYFYAGIPIVHHWNPAYGHLPKDALFNRQQDDWNFDQDNFNQRKARNFDL
ncbi:MAG TPA: hypothetical protein VGZ90_13415 [Puia sp.]|jgi:hypothetical protein|nr:hypothetical protein [Puia sp.]